MSAGDALDPALFGNLRWPLRSFRRGKVLVHKTFGASERGHLCVINSCVCAGTRIQDRENDPLAQTRPPARPSAIACPARLRRTACTVPVLERRWQTASGRKMRSESRRHFPVTSGRPNCPDVRVLSQRTRPLLPPESLSPFDGVCKSTSPRMFSTPAAFRCTRCHDSAGSCHSKTGVAMDALTLSGVRSSKLSRVQGEDRSRGRRGISEN